MNDLLVIAFGAGLHDGLNPCIFMTCAVFIVLSFWLKKNTPRMGWLLIIFVWAYISSFIDFNFGPAQIFTLHKEFILSAKIIYFILGVCAFILGVLFFKDWLLIRRGIPSKEVGGQKTRPFLPQGLMYPAAVILGLSLSALSTLWPINIYVMLLCNGAFLKGQWQAVMPLLTGYIFTSLWPLWFVCAFLSIKNVQPTLLKIVCAAIFFTASSCAILIFK